MKASLQLLGSLVAPYNGVFCVSERVSEVTNPLQRTLEEPQCIVSTYINVMKENAN